MVAAGAETHAALGADHCVLFAQAVTAAGADGNRRTMAVHGACGYQASGNHLLAPAFSFNKGSHGVLLSAVMKVVAPRRSSDRAPGREREERRNRNREMLPPGKRM